MMRKFKLILFGLGVLMGGTQVDAEAFIFELAADKAVTVRYTQTVSAGVSTAAVVIDLSDATNWPHEETKEVNINAIRLDIDKVAASTATVKLGVVNFVNASTGSVTWFMARSSSMNVSNTDVSQFVNYWPQYLKLKTVTQSGATDGLTPFILSNDKTSGSTTYQTDVALPTASGTDAAPGPGDIVISIVNPDAGNAIIVGVEIQYHTN